MCAAAILLVGCSSGGGEPDRAGASASNDDPLAFHEAVPPWPLVGRQADRMRLAGVPLLRAEGKLVHYHAHLDVFYDGDEVGVPANIGIDYEERVISPLHTHFDTGVIHVEADEEAEFTLGQFLTEWGVKVDGDCVADKCGAEVAVFVNGSIQDEPTVELVIKPDTEIALVLGTPPADIPSGYKCVHQQDACPNTASP